MPQKLSLTLVLAILSLPAAACLNDRDSELMIAMDNMPQVTDAITGRFERNPPLFYELRVARVQKELAQKPESLPLYDDIAVALDRLHRDDEAIVWMEKKRQVLQKIAPDESLKTANAKEHWYRYHANIGTFFAHRSLKNRNQPSQIDLQQAHSHIARAIAIKPEAHFGREPVQLMAIDWIREGRHMSLATFIQKRFPGWFKAQQAALKSQRRKFSREEVKWLSKEERRAAAEGLAGLIVLGAAWESVDVFAALAGQTDWELSNLARYRYEELQTAGKTSLSTVEPLPSLVNPNDDLRSRYKTLREDADLWQKERTDYLLARLSPTHHPDTDPSFWSEWKPRPKPIFKMDRTFSHALGTAFMIGVLSIPVVLLVLLIRFTVRKVA